MRSFYRAVKRGEGWALKIWTLRNKPIQYIMALMYRNVDFTSLVFTKNPLLELIRKDNNFQGKYFPVPIVWGKK